MQVCFKLISFDARLSRIDANLVPVCHATGDV